MYVLDHVPWAAPATPTVLFGGAHIYQTGQTGTSARTRRADQGIGRYRRPPSTVSGARSNSLDPSPRAERGPRATARPRARPRARLRSRPIVTKKVHFKCKQYKVSQCQAELQTDGPQGMLLLHATAIYIGHPGTHSLMPPGAAQDHLTGEWTSSQLAPEPVLGVHALAALPRSCHSLSQLAVPAELEAHVLGYACLPHLQP